MNIKYLTTTPVPFAPVPGHLVEMKLDPDDTWTLSKTPLMAMAQEAFRDAAYDLMIDHPDYTAQAIATAETGVLMEHAYMARMRAEYKAVAA